MKVRTDGSSVILYLISSLLSQHKVSNFGEVTLVSGKNSHTWKMNIEGESSTCSDPMPLVTGLMVALRDSHLAPLKSRTKSSLKASLFISHLCLSEIHPPPFYERVRAPPACLVQNLQFSSETGQNLRKPWEKSEKTILVIHFISLI